MNGAERHTGTRRQRRAVLALRLVSLVLLAFPAAVAAQSNAVQGTLRGRVIDETTGAGIPDVHIEFMDGRTRIQGSALTDHEGNFILTSMPRGFFRLRANRIGYTRTVTPYWQLQSGEILTVTVHLHPDAVLLAPLEVLASARSESPVVSSYYRRLERRTGGTFITREEIERSNAGTVTDLLRMVPGVRIEGGFGQHARLVSFARTVTSVANGCQVQIYLDGMLASRSNTDPVSVDELATPGGLEGIEIHRGIATVPPEFLSPDARCGVIALWTRRGG